MKLDDLALEIVTELRSTVGRERFVYDDGDAHISAEHTKKVEELVHKGVTQEDFVNALIHANDQFADNFIQAKIDRSTLTSGEAHVADALREVEKTENPALIDSAREFARTLLSNEILGSRYRNTGAYGESLGEQRLCISTNASWVGRLVEAGKAIHNALEGNFESSRHSVGINYFADANAYDSASRALKSCAKAFRADVKDHLAASPPKPGLDANHQFNMNG